MRITCVIGTLGGGGAERVMTYLSGGLALRSHQVTLLTLDDSVPDFYEVPEGVTRARVNLPTFKKAGFFGGFARLWKMTCALRQTRPDVVISFMTVSVLASCLLLRVPYIYADHLDVRYLTYSRKWQILRDFLLARAHTVTILSERDRKFIELYHSKWTPQVIYNPALPPKQGFLPRPEFMPDRYQYVVAVGRLVHQKGFDRLLEAWQRVCNGFPNWKLLIIGAGPEENDLRSLADTLGVQHCVQIVPPVKGLAAVYRHAQIYAMSSHAEGFPMALLEAMSAGLPAVSFACTGPDVIIRDGTDGFLVKQNHIDKFAEKLAELMRNEPLRVQFAKNAQQVIKRFSLKDYIDAYENLCKDAVK